MYAEEEQTLCQSFSKNRTGESNLFAIKIKVGNNKDVNHPTQVNGLIINNVKLKCII